ncbi:general stress protein [Kribbella sp. NPDC051770]|uniref:general stress protein n=1 Tax=Kribbella sp. NPDC051770 TaxID=3155413 RepID=UPI00342B74C3
MTIPQEQPTALVSGVSVGAFSSYADAQRAVDYLSDNGFPVENLTIIGSDLKQVEKVVGRVTKWKAALGGAGTGAWFGALVGLLLSLFAESGTQILVVIAWGLLYGAIFGAVWGFVAHLFSFGQRDFATVGATVASRFDVYCEPAHADRALAMLSRMSPRHSA